MLVCTNQVSKDGLHAPLHGGSSGGKRPSFTSAIYLSKLRLGALMNPAKSKMPKRWTNKFTPNEGRMLLDSHVILRAKNSKTMRLSSVLVFGPMAFFAPSSLSSSNVVNTLTKRSSRSNAGWILWWFHLKHWLSPRKVLYLVLKVEKRLQQPPFPRHFFQFLSKSL